MQMIHTRKILGLYLLAACMICAVTAPAASAAPVFHTEVEDTILTDRKAWKYPPF
jgi:hypothetical protein